MIYDGDCSFCSRWVRRWQDATGDRLDYLPFQDPSVAARYPEVPRGRFETAVQLIEADGRVYGDSSTRWVLNARLDSANQLVLSWSKDAVTQGVKSVVVQTNYDGGYHDFALRNAGGNGAVDILFDGAVVGSELSIGASPRALPPGLNQGSASTSGMVKANWNQVNFTLGSFSISGAAAASSNAFHVLFPSRTNRTYGLYRATNEVDWFPLVTNVPGTGATASATDTNPLSVGAPLYRVRMNP